MKLKEPHILLAGPNCRKLARNLAHILDSTAVAAIEAEIVQNVISLYRLGEEHLTFALSVNSAAWRQKTSRLYYGAYNIRRAVALYTIGHYSTDSSDHKAIGDIPDDFPNQSTYIIQLKSLREDRNLADYSHNSSESDLISPMADSESLVKQFQLDTKSYLTSKGVTL